MEEKPKPKFKVGDIVTIRSRVGYAGDYQFYFTGRMAEKAGKQFKVTKVSFEGINSSKIFPSDGYMYKLEEGGDDFNWSSSMFEDPSGSTGSSNTESISAFIRKKKCPELDFSL